MLLCPWALRGGLVLLWCQSPQLICPLLPPLYIILLQPFCPHPLSFFALQPALPSVSAKTPASKLTKTSSKGGKNKGATSAKKHTTRVDDTTPQNNPGMNRKGKGKNPMPDKEEMSDENHMPVDDVFWISFVWQTVYRKCLLTVTLMPASILQSTYWQFLSVSCSFYWLSA